MRNNELKKILYRVEKRELQVDIAAEYIEVLFLNDAEVAEPVDEDQLSLFETKGVGVLTTYNAMETKQSRSDEDTPLSDDQIAELEGDDEDELGGDELLDDETWDDDEWDDDDGEDVD